MAFTQTIAGNTSVGHKRMLWGTYSGAGVTTGTLSLGTFVPDVVTFTSTSGTPSDIQAVISGSSVALTFASGQTGTWNAIGA